MPDFELEELMKRESSVKTELSTVVYTENMVNLSGLAKLPDQEDKTMVQPNEECRLEHGCQCDGWKEEDLLEEAEDGITNVDAKQWQKLNPKQPNNLQKQKTTTQPLPTTPTNLA